MITLITGTPGAGKTLYALTEVFPQFEGRTVYVDGIPDLTLNHELPPGEVEGANTDYSKWLPDGSVLIVDECQRVWRPRSSGAAVPPGVRHMETHRHHGHDLVLITQHPNLLDSNVRRLVGRHLHVRRVWGWNRAIVYEWDQATDPGRTSTATKKTWAYPKSAFGIYKSASVHTARGQKPPILLYLVIILPLLLGFFIYQTYSSINQRINPVKKQQVENRATVQNIPAQQTAVYLDPEKFIPRNADQPASAPAYDGLYSISAVPRIEHCIASQSRCVCYTQQITRVQVSDEKCRRIASGLEFDPYQEDMKPVQSRQVDRHQKEHNPPDPVEQPPVPQPEFEGVVNLT